MKNYNLIILFSTIFFLFGCGVVDTEAVDTQYTIDKPYDFRPITEAPGFAYLPNREKLEALQLPEDILNKMTTRTLVETCLNYPLFTEVMTSSSGIRGGMQTLIEQKFFNGFNELLERKDAYIYLREKFLSFDQLAITNKGWSGNEWAEYRFKLTKILLLLGRDEVLESANASYESKISLLRGILLKFEKTLTREEEHYAGYPHGELFFLICKILHKSGNPSIPPLIEDNRLLDSARNMDILSIAIKIVNQ